MAVALRKIAPADESTYHGFPVLSLRVDDPLPQPQAPERYAIRVYPDLARYLLTFNHPNNRNVQVRTYRRYATDMRDGNWQLLPGGLVFTRSNTLSDGQHRLHGVCEYGGDVWFLVDFGWPDEIIRAIDHGKPRSVADVMRIDGGVVSATTVSSTINKWVALTANAGQTRSFSSLVPPTAAQTFDLYHARSEFWNTAVRAGERIYRALDHGFSPAVWGACFALIMEKHGEDAAAFYDEVREGTGAPRSASRVLGDWARRRPVTATKTGDNREPYEVIIRAFNAWKAGTGMAMPKAIGFALSRVR